MNATICDNCQKTVPEGPAGAPVEWIKVYRGSGFLSHFCGEECLAAKIERDGTVFHHHKPSFIT